VIDGDFSVKNIVQQMIQQLVNKWVWNRNLNWAVFHPKETSYKSKCSYYSAPTGVSLLHSLSFVW